MKIGIIGVTGRVGKKVLANAIQKNIPVVFGSASSSSPFLGYDLGELIDASPLNLYVTKTAGAPFDSADILIDFSLASATEENMSKAVQHQKPLLIGTTGYSEKTFELIQKASTKIPLLVSANFSVGIQLCMDAVKILCNDAKQIKIIETHHTTKKDTPSGTSLMFKKALNDKAHIESIRRDDHMGEHTIIFDMESERVTLTHTSFSRDIFAQGALKAAEFLIQQPPGLYDMADCLSWTGK